MTSEERFERIEKTLDRITERQDKAAERADKAEVAHEVAMHDFDQRYKQLLEMQGVLMTMQEATWKTLERLEANIDKMIRGRGANGHEG